MLNRWHVAVDNNDFNLLFYRLAKSNSLSSTALTDNHHFPELVCPLHKDILHHTKQVESISPEFLVFFSGLIDCSLKTNIMLRSSGTDFRLINNSVVPKCLSEQHWNRIYGCFYFESLLISCTKGRVLMLLPRSPNFSGSFRACGGGWRSATRKKHSTHVKCAGIEATLVAARTRVLLISHGDHRSAEFNVTPAFQHDVETSPLLFT